MFFAVFRACDLVSSAALFLQKFFGFYVFGEGFLQLVRIPDWD